MLNKEKLEKVEEFNVDKKGSGYGRQGCVLQVDSCYTEKEIVNLILEVRNRNGWKL